MLLKILFFYFFLSKYPFCHLIGISFLYYFDKDDIWFCIRVAIFFTRFNAENDILLTHDLLKIDKYILKPIFKFGKLDTTIRIFICFICISHKDIISSRKS